jgi:uncharacterized protein
MLAQHEHGTGNQIVVVTLKSLQGYPIEEFGYRLGRHWEIGQKGRNNGAILLVAPNERKVRIEVGYGLEGQLTDAQSRSIIERDILPAFRRGDFQAGVLNGTSAMLRVLNGGGSTPARSSKALAWQEALAVGIALFLVLIGPVGAVIRLVLYGKPPRRVFVAASGGGSTGDSHGSRSAGGGGGGDFSGGGGDFGGGGASGSW